jgi:hypothetical protein
MRRIAYCLIALFSVVWIGCGDDTSGRGAGTDEGAAESVTIKGTIGY